MRQRLFLASGIGFALAGLAVYSPGCSAGTADSGVGGEIGSGTTASVSGSGDATNATGQTVASSSTGFIMEDAGPDAPPDVPVNPCGTECPDPPGSVPDKCTDQFRGIDDNCDGQVDEGCSCTPGEASACFKGDPSYRDEPGCSPGTQICNELGQWGDCLGGQHATENCYANNQDACHAISALPFQTVSLSDGAGTFDDNADPGSNVWELECPMGVMPCPVPDANGNVQVLVSGEYTVTYTKTVGGNSETCSFPLNVGARGLRVELTWNYDTNEGDDIDFHMHQPDNVQPWDIGSPGSNQDCGWGNCYMKGNPMTATFPSWFPGVQAMPGDPVDWYTDPLLQANTCYFAPRGIGELWQQRSTGCHNPRLDLDNTGCDQTVTDTDDTSFCAPENINVDFPPKNTWIRVAAFGWRASANNTPTVRIYCDGALAAELGPQGYNAPVVIGNRMLWSVADVAFKEDQCVKQCIVKPLYANDDDVAKLPLFQTEDDAEAMFAPPYPPAP